MRNFTTGLVKIAIFAFSLLAIINSYAQKHLSPLVVTDFNMTISNDVQTGPRVLEFDIFLKDIDAAQPFETSIVQPGVYISKSCLGGGTPVITMVPASSEMSAGLIPNSFAYASITAALGEIKIAARPAPGCGSGTFLSQTDPGTKFCRVRVTNSVDFVTGSQANLTWDFATAVPNLQTKVYYYTSGCASTQITCNASNCFNVNYTNVVLNPPPPPTAYAVTGGGSYCEPGAGMPVGLANSQVGVTYTLYQGATALSPTFAGTGAAISMGTRPGTFVYSVSGTSAGGTTPMSNTVTVTMNTMPVITFGALADVIVGSPAITLTATPTGGVYSGNPYLSGDQFNPSTVGTYNITYNYSDPITSCPATPVTQPINVKTPTWTGSIDADWNTTGNWLINHIPLTGDNAVIPASCPHYPVLGAGTSGLCNNLTIQSGSVTISTTASLTVGGTLTITPTDGLVIESDASGTGSLIENGTAGAGNAKIQRYLSAYTTTTDQRYHFLSSPVDAQNINIDFIDVSGTSGEDFYKFDEVSATWINARADGNVWNIAFDETAFVPGRGYLVSYPEPAPTKIFTGKLNTGSLPLTCTFTELTTPPWGGHGWNLIGNPFASAIDWDLVIAGGLSGVNDALYYYDATAENYRYYIPAPDHSVGLGTGSRYIPAMQGFMVRVQSPGPTGTVTLNHSMRTHNLGVYYKNTQSSLANYLVLTVNGNNYSDQAFVLFANEASPNFDGRYDATKLMSMKADVPMIYTITPDLTTLAINCLPPSETSRPMPLAFIAGADGAYTITASELNTFQPDAIITLEDLKSGVTQNMMQNPVYAFTGSTTDDKNRFLLHFAGNIGIADQKEVAPVKIYAVKKTVYISCASGLHNGEVTVSNLLGQNLVTKKLNDQALNQVQLTANEGYYIVKVQTDTTVKTAKVFIK